MTAPQAALKAAPRLPGPLCLIGLIFWILDLIMDWVLVRHRLMLCALDTGAIEVFHLIAFIILTQIGVDD